MNYRPRKQVEFEGRVHSGGLDFKCVHCGVRHESVRERQAHEDECELSPRQALRDAGRGHLVR
jgi:hypothetical protein